MPTPGYGYCETCAHSIGGQEGMGVTKGSEPADELGGLAPHPIVDEDWQRVVQQLPIDLEESAREAGALQRRREVRRAEDLLRMALAYALCDWSLRLVAAWAYLQGWASLSDTALMHRLRGCRLWLGVLVAAWVLRTRAELVGCPVRLRLVDATVISRPGSKGTDWRVHVSLDLGRGCFDGLDVTDGKGAEALTRYPAGPADIILADAGYGQGRGIGRMLADGTKLVVRIAVGNVRFIDEGGSKLDLLEWLREVPTGRPVEREARIETPEGTFRVRLVAARLSQQAAERARRRVRRRAQRNGRTPDKRSLEAAGFIAVLSTLDRTWTPVHLLALYRLRWQVEMAFKRLKGVLELDGLRATDPDLAQVYLLAKLLGALLADRMGQAGPVVSPDWFESTERPVSPWRWLVLWSDAVKRAVQGTLPLQGLIRGLPRLRRYLSDAPRRRKQQCALGRRLLQILMGTANIHLADTHDAQLLLP